MAVRVKATFKKDTKEFDGLGAISDQLAADPLQRRVIVAVIEVTNIDHDVLEGGTKIPKVRLVNVEALTGDDALHARKMLEAVYHERTGQTAPPPTLFDDGAPHDDEAVDDSAWPGDAGSADAPKRGRGK